MSDERKHNLDELDKVLTRTWRALDDALCKIDDARIGAPAYGFGGLDDTDPYEYNNALAAFNAAVAELDSTARNAVTTIKAAAARLEEQ